MAEAAVLVKLGLIVLASSTPHYQGEYKHGPRAVFGGTGRGVQLVTGHSLLALFQMLAFGGLQNWCSSSGTYKINLDNRKVWFYEI